ncbi:MAG: SDR family oxidoreductase [Variibacter sp.]|nr:SDR family oxidoreductase [Variibacter sp.]
MRVLLTGAYGLIGSAILERLQRDGHTVVAAGRSLARARRQFPFAEWVAADFDRLTTPGDWRPLLAGIDAVVNCVGAFQSGARDNLSHVHVDAPRALFAACERHGPRRVIQVSAIGAAPDAGTELSRSKGEGDATLAASSLEWLILRPGVVLAPNVYGATAMLRGLAGLPLLVPLFEPGREIEIVAVEDVAATVAWALSPDARLRQTFDLVHPQKVSLAAIVQAQQRWLGFRAAPVKRLPSWLARTISAAADALGLLGWRSPARSTAMAQVVAGIAGDPRPWMQATGIAPRGLADIMAARAASLPDRWFARLYFVKPLAIATLALFWIATGLIALSPGWGPSHAHLAWAGIAGTSASAMIVAGALFDIVLGALLLWRPATRAVLVIMLVASPGYILAGTLLAPHLWSDPLGALTKVFPLLLATVFTLAVLDER